MSNPVDRFSSRVTDYDKYRPSYPLDLINKLMEQSNLNQRSVIADIGSGTGIFTELLVNRGVKVIGIEPNDAMRHAAENKLSHKANFTSLNATAESTCLKEGSIDLITAAQSFHWFNKDKTIPEFKRILKPNGALALVWNQRCVEQDFQIAYDEILGKYSKDYDSVNHKNLKVNEVPQFFESNRMETFTYTNEQLFDYEGLLGRIRSSSYCPLPCTTEYSRLVKDLEVVFHQFSSQDQVKFKYKSHLFIGPICC
ncbi:class I SAM-dependent methyltransferase [Vibrio sp. J1-1]|uniref:class I SAM-dependent methyltransferase n=1 Tax=Vibrio sp. J1-1 TaxID=2912251 RepID=UPI001F3638F9|nr:class I SAM-dependent methyltransferase [Vibrio sp. J1-1]MCF7484335.1 class I SAM-dependent methyltransferase [Vibrio sp. J1-1]